MAVKKKISILSLLLSVLVLHLVRAGQTYQLQLFCLGCSPCRPEYSQRACGTCCARCNCVPPGTYGNWEFCPCYASITTRNNKRKCP